VMEVILPRLNTKGRGEASDPTLGPEPSCFDRHLRRVRFSRLKGRPLVQKRRWGTEGGVNISSMKFRRNRALKRRRGPKSNMLKIRKAKKIEEQAVKGKKKTHASLAPGEPPLQLTRAATSDRTVNIGGGVGKKSTTTKRRKKEEKK